MAVIDVCSYNGEKDLWDIHYNVLKDHVDAFVVVEFNRTFSGKSKQPTFDPSGYENVHYFFHTDINYAKYAELAGNSPNTAGASHWAREFMQKESIKDALEAMDLKDDDIVFIGDVDEVWSPHLVKIFKEQPGFLAPMKLKLDVYTYYLNNRSTEQFWGTLVASYKTIKDKCLNHLRSDADKVEGNGMGWHFTSMGGVSALKQKLEDSYTEESYATPEVLDNLEENYGDKDFLGRNFTYTVDESDWPQYLKENKDKYKHLCR